MNEDFICPVCGGTEFGHCEEDFYEWYYCRKCMTNFNDDGERLPDGPIPDEEDTRGEAESKHTE